MVMPLLMLLFNPRYALSIYKNPSYYSMDPPKYHIC